MSADPTADRIYELANQLRTLDLLAEVRRDIDWWNHSAQVLALLEDVTK